MIYGHIFGGDIMEHFKRGVLLTLIGGTCWGFSGASGQFLFTHYQANPMWLTSMRMCFAGLLITLFGALTQKEAMKRLVSQKKDLIKTFGFGFVLMLCQFTYLQAINTSNAGTASVLQYLSPIYIMIFVCLTSKRLPNKIEALCCLSLRWCLCDCDTWSFKWLSTYSNRIILGNILWFYSCCIFYLS